MALTCFLVKEDGCRGKSRVNEGEMLNSEFPKRHEMRRLGAR